MPVHTKNCGQYCSDQPLHGTMQLCIRLHYLTHRLSYADYIRISIAFNATSQLHSKLLQYHLRPYLRLVSTPELPCSDKQQELASKA